MKSPEGFVAYLDHVVQEHEAYLQSVELHRRLTGAMAPSMAKLIDEQAFAVQEDVVRAKACKELAQTDVAAAMRVWVGIEMVPGRVLS